MGVYDAHRAGLIAHWREHRRQGSSTLAYRFARRLLDRSRLVARMDFQIHQVIAVAPSHLRLPPRMARGIAVAELGLADLEAMQALRPSAGAPYAMRFQQAHRCIGAWLDDRLVAFMWMRCGPANLPASFGCVWQVTAPILWLYDLYSDPQLLGAIPHLYAYLRRHPPGQNLQHFVGQTDYDNLRSRLAHRSIGYEVRATLFSWRLGRWFLHLSRDHQARRWRWHRGQALIPLFLFAANATATLPATDFSQASSAPNRKPVFLQCSCGREVPLAGDVFRCACGRKLGQMRDDIAIVGEPVPYWGEISKDDMEALFALAAQAGWRVAMEQRVPARLHRYIADSERAAFHELLPLPAGASILDVGAGWGGIAAALARHYSVVALEGVAERARFIALRQRQEGLQRLQVLLGDVHQVPLALRQFDAIIANGILEWVALSDLSATPTMVQLLFLHRLRSLLAPGGFIYLGIENRYGWSEWRGALDHSGLPFTSLLPRPLARWWCARSPLYRSHFNVGYRTYTYSQRAYADLFQQVGLCIQTLWISPSGYNHPDKLIPPHAAAIRFAVQRSPHGGVPRLLRQALSHGWIWRHLGSDFAFLLQPGLAAPENHFRPTEPVAPTATAGGGAAHA